MASVAFALDVDFTVVECNECGGAYALSTPYYTKRQREGGYWNCPYCRCQYGWGKSKTENARLRDQLKQANDKAERERQMKLEARRQTAHARKQRDHEAKRANGYKGAMVKAKKKAANGQCPCCHEHFQDLADHIQLSHPEFAAEHAAEKAYV